MSYLPEMERQEQARRSTGIDVPCGNCQKPVPIPTDGTAFYWSRFGYELRPVYCAKCAVVANAPMIKPQPKGTQIDGWDV